MDCMMTIQSYNDPKLGFLAAIFCLKKQLASFSPGCQRRIASLKVQKTWVKCWSISLFILLPKRGHELNSSAISYILCSHMWDNKRSRDIGVEHIFYALFHHVYFVFAGFPQVEYRWMKDGIFLSDFSSEHFYKIQSVSRTDAGDYRCYAKNSVGTIISEKIKLTVACKS